MRQHCIISPFPFQYIYVHSDEGGEKGGGEDGTKISWGGGGEWSIPGHLYGLLGFM